MTLPRRDSITRRLALAKLRELRASGLAYREIARLFAPPSDIDRGSRPRTAAPDGPARGSAAAIADAARQVPDARPFLRALDAVDQALGFYDGTGKLIHSNRTMREHLAVQGNGEQLLQELALFVDHACALVRLRGLQSAEHVAEDLTLQEEVPSSAQTTPGVRLRASFIGFDLFASGPTILVSFQSTGPDPLSDQSLRARFGLTRQESRIARLIARGRRNDDIARELSISPHTVRRHTEAIFTKLGVKSRTALSARLRS